MSGYPVELQAADGQYLGASLIPESIGALPDVILWYGAAYRHAHGAKAIMQPQGDRIVPVYRHVFSVTLT